MMQERRSRKASVKIQGCTWYAVCSMKARKLHFWTHLDSILQCVWAASNTKIQIYKLLNTFTLNPSCSATHLQTRFDHLPDVPTLLHSDDALVSNYCHSCHGFLLRVVRSIYTGHRVDGLSFLTSMTRGFRSVGADVVAGAEGWKTLQNQSN